MKKKIAIIYDSPYGHTEKLAQFVKQGVDSVDGIEGILYNATDLANINHLKWAEVAKVDAVIFGSPTYMGSVSAGMKLVMDNSSKNIWATSEWKNKLAAGFTNSASQNGDKLNSLITMVIYSMQMHMIWVGLGLPPANNSSKGSPEELNRLGSWLGAMAQSNSDQGAELVPPKADLDTAAFLGKRVATLLLSWNV